jgi:predicted nucleotide-binding protein
MKQQFLGDVTLDVTNRFVVMAGIELPPERVLLVVNVTAGFVYHNLTDTHTAYVRTFGGNTIIEFEPFADCELHQNSDHVAIFYEDGVDLGALVRSKSDETQTLLGDFKNEVAAKMPALFNGRVPVDVGGDDSPLPVSAAALPLPLGASTETTLSAISTRMGLSTDAPWSGGGTGYVIPILKALFGQLGFGQKVASSSHSVVVATDQTAIPVSNESLTSLGDPVTGAVGSRVDQAAPTLIANSSIVSLVKSIWNAITSESAVMQSKIGAESSAVQAALNTEAGEIQTVISTESSNVQGKLLDSSDAIVNKIGSESAAVQASLAADLEGVQTTVETESGNVRISLDAQGSAVIAKLGVESTAIQTKIEQILTDDLRDSIVTKIGLESAAVRTQLDVESGELQMVLATESSNVQGKLLDYGDAIVNKVGSESTAVQTKLDAESGEIQTVIATESGNVQTKLLEYKDDIVNTLQAVSTELQTKLNTESSELQSVLETQSLAIQTKMDQILVDDFKNQIVAAINTQGDEIQLKLNTEGDELRSDVALLDAKLPASLGAKSAAASLSVAFASDQALSVSSGVDVISGSTPHVNVGVMALSSAPRKYLLIQNHSDGPIWVNFGAPVTSSTLRIDGGGAIVFEGTFIPSDEIHLVGTDVGAAHQSYCIIWA